MNWFQYVVLVVGIIDALMVLIGGGYAAFLVSTSGDLDARMQRVMPAMGIVIASNVGATIILWVVHGALG